MAASTQSGVRNKASDRQESGEAHRAAAEFWRNTAKAEDASAAADRERARVEERQADREGAAPRMRQS